MQAYDNKGNKPLDSVPSHAILPLMTLPDIPSPHAHTWTAQDWSHLSPDEKKRRTAIYNAIRLGLPDFDIVDNLSEDTTKKIAENHSLPLLSLLSNNELIHFRTALFSIAGTINALIIKEHKKLDREKRSKEFQTTVEALRTSGKGSKIIDGKIQTPKQRLTPQEKAIKALMRTGLSEEIAKTLLGEIK